MIVAPCSNVYITLEAGERCCLRCFQFLYEGGNMDLDMDLYDDDDDEVWDEDIFDDDDEHLCPPLSVATSAAPKTGMTIRSTKSKRFFKRESLSMPVMYLRWKWKESVARSLSLAGLSVKYEPEPEYESEAKPEMEHEFFSCQDASSSGDYLGAETEVVGLGLGRGSCKTSPGASGDVGAGRGNLSRFYRGVQFGKK